MIWTRWGGTASNPVTKDIGTATATLTDDANEASGTNIKSYGADDHLVFSNVAESDVNVSVADGNTTFTFDDGAGTVSEVTLVGISGFWTSVAEFNSNSSVGDVKVTQAPTISGDLEISTVEGTAVTLTSSDLEASDGDDSDSDLTYTVTSGPANGRIEVSGSVVSSFTEAALDAGNVEYVHDGSETTADSFDFTVSDDAGASVSDNFSITIDAVPNLAIADGGSNNLDFSGSVTPGTNDNPVGIFALSAGQAGASFEGVTVQNNSPGVSGISAARLYWSGNQTLETSTDDVLDTYDVTDNSADASFPFSGFSRSIPTSAQYVILAIDVQSGASGEVSFELAQDTVLSTPGGDLTTVNGNSTSSFSALPLSNGTTALPVELSGFEASLTEGAGAKPRHRSLRGAGAAEGQPAAVRRDGTTGANRRQRSAGGPEADAGRPLRFVQWHLLPAARRRRPDAHAEAHGRAVKPASPAPYTGSVREILPLFQGGPSLKTPNAGSSVIEDPAFGMESRQDSAVRIDADAHVG